MQVPETSSSLVYIQFFKLTFSACQEKCVSWPPFLHSGTSIFYIQGFLYCYRRKRIKIWVSNIIQKATYIWNAVINALIQLINRLILRTLYYLWWDLIRWNISLSSVKVVGFSKIVFQMYEKDREISQHQSLHCIHCSRSVGEFHCFVLNSVPLFSSLLSSPSYPA